MAQNWNKIDAIDINKIEDSRTKQRQSPFESESYFKLPIFSRCVSERQNGILVRIDFQFRTITLLSNLIFVVANISYYFSIIYSDRKNVEGMLRWVLGEYTYIHEMVTFRVILSSTHSICIKKGCCFTNNIFIATQEGKILKYKRIKIRIQLPSLR